MKNGSKKPFSRIFAWCLIVCLLFSTTSVTYAAEGEKIISNLMQTSEEEVTENERVLTSENIPEDTNDKVADNSETDPAIDKVIELFKACPTAKEIVDMTEDEFYAITSIVTDAMGAYSALDNNQQTLVMEQNAELYQAVMVDLNLAMSEKMAGMGNNEVDTTSLLPLEERKAYLVVGDHEGVDISAVPLDIILKNLRDSEGNVIEIDQNAKIVWSYYKDLNDNVISDDYFLIEEGGTLNLSLFEEYDRYTLEMIIGDGNQLNPNNIRYIVTVYLSDMVSGLRTYEIYTQDEDGTRHKIEPTDQQVTGTTINGIHSAERTFIVPEHVKGKEYYLGVNDPLDEHPFIQCDVISFADYLGYILYESLGLGEYKYTSLSKQFINQNMDKKDAGYKNNWDAPEITDSSIEVDNTFGFLYKNVSTGKVQEMELLTFVVSNGENELAVDDNAYIYEADGFNSVKLDTDTTISPDDLQNNGFYYAPSSVTNIRRVWLKKGFSPDNEYYYTLLMQKPEWKNPNEHIEKAVVGKYSSLDEAADAEDISAQLLPKTTEGAPFGYKANYDISKGGQYFTVFLDDGTIEKYLIVFCEYDKETDLDYVKEYSDIPIIGEPDPWFRVTGAEKLDGKIIDTYVIENGKNINIDTSYGYGYQTVFMNEDVDSFIPTFWRANDEKISIKSIYVNDKRYRIGDSLSFPDDSNTINVRFGVIITDKNGEHQKQYNVTFFKKTTGPSLYVAGPLAPKTRTVLLDETHENLHDIFIANVGDAPLENLWLDIDATNCKLDDYWNVGGENNNTLSACPENFSAELAETQYGELSNIAKIRLIPLDKKNPGEVNGTLKIYSGETNNPEKSALLATIILSNQAQQPDIVTEELGQGVLYVPYSHLISTDNMYSWLNVEFSKIDGDLPKGITLNEKTGEIYGVPMETGQFTFTVQAMYTVKDDYSSNTNFVPSTKKYTLNILTNEHTTVYNTSYDEQGYGFKTTGNADGDDGVIGIDIDGTGNFVKDDTNSEAFISLGEYDWFHGLYSVDECNVWLDGQKLIEGVDYDSESGSTRITVRQQTFEKPEINDGKEHTISVEFRVNGDRSDELRRTSQNFTINKPKTDSAVDNVIALINKIPSMVTLNAKSTIQTARKAYDTLNSSQKTKVTNYNRLVAAEDAIKALEINAKDKAEADKVIKLINAIPSTITLNCKNDIVKARNAYNMLTANQKKYVEQSYVNKLNVAEKKIAELEAAERKDENNKDVGKIIFVGRVVDKNDNSLSDYIVEMHSMVQTARTDKNGYFRFTNVEMGNHNIFIKDKGGKLIATKEFSIVEGSPLSLEGNVITAEDGSVATVSIRINNKEIEFVSVEEGDKTPDNITNIGNEEGINIGKPYGTPDTGDNTNLMLWFNLLFILFLGFVSAGYYNKKKQIK